MLPCTRQLLCNSSLEKVYFRSKLKTAEHYRSQRSKTQSQVKNNLQILFFSVLFHYPAPEGDFAISDHLCLRLSYLVSMTARALVCLTWTVLMFFFLFFFCSFSFRVCCCSFFETNIVFSALHEHMNVVCFSTTLLIPCLRRELCSVQTDGILFLYSGSNS